MNESEVGEEQYDPDEFQSTRWSVVSAARRADDPQASAALGELSATYWRPVYHFLRRHGKPHHEAQDLTQDLFAHLLSAKMLQYADRDRGRFRSFLLSAVKQLMAKQWRKDSAQKRGAGKVLSNFDFDSEDSLFRQQPGDSLSPEQLYDKQWAQAVIRQVISNLADEYRRKNKEKLFEALQVFLVEKDPSESYGDIADQLGVNEGAVRVAVHRLRRRCGELVRQEVAHTVSDAEKVDDELGYLLNLLQK